MLRARMSLLTSETRAPRAATSRAVAAPDAAREGAAGRFDREVEDLAEVRCDEELLGLG